MSEVKFGASQKANKEYFSWRPFIMVTIIGVVIVALPVPLGKKWHPGEMVSDLGIAVITVALVQLCVLRFLRQLALRRSKLDLEMKKCGKILNNPGMICESGMRTCTISP